MDENLEEIKNQPELQPEIDQTQIDQPQISEEIVADNLPSEIEVVESPTETTEVVVEEAEEVENESPTEGSLIINGADLDTCLQRGFKSNCKICKHEGAKDSVYIYYNSDKNIEVVKKWFNQKYDFDITSLKLEVHFKRHVDPYSSKELVARDQRQVQLLRKATEKPTIDRFAVMREMHWIYMNQIYDSIPMDLKDSKNREEHRKSTKQFTELVKSYTETCKTEWEMLGQGKSEEEQKEIVKNYVKNTIQKNLDSIRDFPDAYKKLAQKMGIESPSFVREESLEKDDQIESITE